MGVNDRLQLAAAEAAMQRRLRRKAMLEGATLIAPETVFLSTDAAIGRDVTIEPHVVIGAGVTIGDGAVIHAFSHLEGAKVAGGAAIGPYARLRPGADIAAKAKVGNFVEIKASTIEAGAKVNHLSYIGDARVGAGTNIGAGTITCNYDGFGKYRTDIGAGAFIGSNSALVAPVKIGDGAYVGSGSVITDDVEADALAVARGRQAVKPGWAKAFRERDEEEEGLGVEPLPPSRGKVAGGAGRMRGVARSATAYDICAGRAPIYVSLMQDGHPPLDHASLRARAACERRSGRIADLGPRFATGDAKGAKFQRQVALGRFLVDFVCFERRLVVEVDGPSHESEERKAADAARDTWLCGQGFRILRLPNELVIGATELAVARIRAALAE